MRRTAAYSHPAAHVRPRLRRLNRRHLRDFDHERLAELVRYILGGETRHHVGVATRRIWNHHRHSSCGPVRSTRSTRCRGQCSRANSKAGRAPCQAESARRRLVLIFNQHVCLSTSLQPTLTMQEPFQTDIDAKVITDTSAPEKAATDSRIMKVASGRAPPHDNDSASRLEM